MSDTKTAAGPAIKSRKPTGEVPYPLVLLEGPEKAGKSLIPVVLSRSTRVGMTYWFDLGEGAADEYGALPASKYEVIEHDGSYRDILDQLTAVWNEAKRAHDAGEPPVVVVVDSMSALWTMLVNWTNDRARRSNVGKRKLAEDPDAEIDPTSNLWNDANKRHKRVMDLLMTFPGIAIVTARGKEVAVIGPNGSPIQGRTEWKVEGQKFLAYDVSAWVRLSRDPRTAELVGARSLRVSVPKGGSLSMPMTKIPAGSEEWDVCDLERFVFDILGCTGEQARDYVPLRGDDLEGLFDEIAICPTEDDLQAIYDRVKNGLTVDQKPAVVAAVTARLEVLRAPSTDEGTESSPQAPEEPSLDAHGPDSDAEKLRKAAEEISAAEATASVPPATADEQAEADRIAAEEAAVAANEPAVDDPWATGPNDVPMDLEGAEA